LFFRDKEGHVVTNYHVIHNANHAQVTLSNNEKFTATLRGAEPDKDLAVSVISKLKDFVHNKLETLLHSQVLKIDAPGGRSI
jgi:S1-C subfamily serine protease